MIPLDRINDYEGEITGFLKKIDDCRKSPMDRRQKYAEIKEITKILNKKVENLILNTPLGSLGSDFLTTLSAAQIELPKEWKIYKQLVDYTLIEDNEEKESALKDIESQIVEKHSEVIGGRRNILSLVNTIYTSKNNDLIDLFYRKLPVPPLSKFGENKPSILVKHEFEINRAVSKFKGQNVQDKELNAKMLYLQRHIRGGVRIDSEVERISNRYFKNDPDGKIKAKAMIEEANKPYFPKGCSRELCRRLVNGASDITLYDSVSHLLAAEKTDLILDGALYGRSNLQNAYVEFRPAALFQDDVDNGDGNVICMGPDHIDPKCLIGRTIGIELDLEALKKESRLNRNPTMFFKQTDLGFSIGEQSIKIKDYHMSFLHNGRIATRNHANLVLSSHGDLEYYAEIPKDLLISYNVKEMDKILILNFFRYLDKLQVTNKDGEREPATDKIQEIYAQIDSLTDEELTLFLRELGRKMSTTSEFNFSGAYQIDLNALKSITIYDYETVVNKVEIEELLKQLNSENYELLNVLKEGNPELFKSSNFVEFLSSKIDSPAAKDAITALL